MHMGCHQKRPRHLHKSGSRSCRNCTADYQGMRRSDGSTVCQFHVQRQGRNPVWHLSHAPEDRHRVRREHAEHRPGQRPPQDGVLRTGLSFRAASARNKDRVRWAAWTKVMPGIGWWWRAMAKTGPVGSLCSWHRGQRRDQLLPGRRAACLQEGPHDAVSQPLHDPEVAPHEPEHHHTTQVRADCSAEARALTARLRTGTIKDLSCKSPVS